MESGAILPVRAVEVLRSGHLGAEVLTAADTSCLRSLQLQLSQAAVLDGTALPLRHSKKCLPTISLSTNIQLIT